MLNAMVAGYTVFPVVGADANRARLFYIIGIGKNVAAHTHNEDISN